MNPQPGLVLPKLSFRYGFLGSVNRNVEPHPSVLLTDTSPP